MLAFDIPYRPTRITSYCYRYVRFSTFVKNINRRDSPSYNKQRTSNIRPESDDMTLVLMHTFDIRILPHKHANQP